MMSFYWNAETWGEAYPPANWEEIVAAANEKIDEYVEKNHLDADADSDVICDFSWRLWEYYCMNDRLPEGAL